MSQIQFTYERDDGKVRSWPDHILTTSHLSSSVSHVRCLHSASNLSDHVPLCFNYNIACPSNMCVRASHEATIPSFKPNLIAWDKISASDVDHFQQTVLGSLPLISHDLLNCTHMQASCEAHRESIDDCCRKLFDCLSSSAQALRTKRFKVVPGWCEHVQVHKEAAEFWNSLWVQLGCPSTGVVFDIRKRTKANYKYDVRRVKRRKDSIVRNKISLALASKNNCLFWKEIKKVKNSGNCNRRSSPIVDGYSNESDIGSNFRDIKLSAILNSSSTATGNSFLDELNSSITSTELSEVSITPATVLDCLKGLGRDKSDGSCLSSNHLLLAAPVLVYFLSDLFTVVLRHGYMPRLLRDYIVVPVPKPSKDPTCSDSYRPIALAPNLSKVLERCILTVYHKFFVTSDLQFGFKPGFSTSLCTGTLKNVVSSYIHKGSKVYSCFLDASKAFDRVNHDLLFKLLQGRRLPKSVLRFLFQWYKDQSLKVRWNSTLSAPFGVTNGVRQGGVPSPILFTVYMDVLLTRLSSLGIGCYSGNHFVGSLCYADDIAPSPAALRILLDECEKFACEFGLLFNAAKTQLICFGTNGKMPSPHSSFFFLGAKLVFAESVLHLGHLLHCSLDDTADVVRVTRDMCRKANYLLQTFSSCAPEVKTKLIETHCLSMYGAILWKIDCKQIKSFEIAYNNILRRVWRLPRQCTQASYILLLVLPVYWIESLICILTLLMVPSFLIRH